MSGIVSSLVNGARDTLGDQGVSLLATDEPRLNMENPQALYEFLRDLYYNETDLYTALGAEYKGIQGFRNVVHAVVEFYVATVFPGSLEAAYPLQIDSERFRRALADRINDIWVMSNWEEQKQLYVRWAGMLGDAYIQSAVRRNSAGQPDGVYMALIDPSNVTNFDTDERGYLTYIRIDVPRVRQLQNGTTEHYLLTEEWDKFGNRPAGERKPAGRFRRWASTLNQPATPIDDLKGLIDDDTLESFGIDFVPFTHAKFVNDGYPRGLSAGMISLAKSREASRMASELHLKLFRYNQPDLQVVGTARNPDGYIYTPPDLVWKQPSVTDVGGYQRVAKMPPGHELKPIDNRVNYDAHMAAIAAQMTHLQESDVPELAWYQRNESNESGRALRIKLTPAISRAVEVRGNLESAQIRAQQMCLTLGQVHKLPGFSPDEIGTYENGDFEHRFEERDILPMTEDERAEMWLKKAQAAEVLFRIGVSPEFVFREVLGMTAGQMAQNRLDLTPEQAAARVLDQLDETMAR